MDNDTCKFCGSPSLWSSFFDDEGYHDESCTYRTICNDCGEFQDKRRKQSSVETPGLDYNLRHSGLRRHAVNTFRKTKMGEWVVFGPARDVRVGPVRVRKRSGQVETKNVVRLGSTFMVNGVPHVYGYLSEPGRQGRPRRDRYERGGEGWCGYPCPVDGHICTLDHPCHDCL